VLDLAAIGDWGSSPVLVAHHRNRFKRTLDRVQDRDEIGACPSGMWVLPVDSMKSLTVKLEPDQDAWLEQQARQSRRSKGGIIRELIAERQLTKGGSVGHQLRDLCGSLKGSKDLSTRPLKGYGRP
jgi:hypothetical protein